MKVLLTGASGLVGKALANTLRLNGDEVYTLVRRKATSPQEIMWNPDRGVIDEAALAQVSPDAVIHLAGESIVGIWTAKKKAAIKDSRVKGTQCLAEAVARLEKKPEVFISASAIGYYGNRGDELVTELTPQGNAIDRQPREKPFFLLDENWGCDFLSEVCVLWEKATIPARDAGIRTVQVRTGIVLSNQGGALKAMLIPFQLGAAGPLGSGKQAMSWIVLDDLVGIFMHALKTPDLRGPINAVAPNPASNAEFTKALSKRAFLFPPLAGVANIVPAPGPALKLAAGEMGNALLLASCKVSPVRALETGYVFQYPQLDQALFRALNHSNN